jgi:nucleoside recognition membrane protein YjiH
MSDQEKAQDYKVSWKGWLALAFLCVSFSGILGGTSTAWRALDFNVLVGKFGTIADSRHIFQGAGGTGAREGFLIALTLVPTTMLALGLIQACEALGALRAAEKIFRPLLRPFMGIPGVAGLAFVSSFTSSDVGAVMTKGLVEDGMMTDDERTIFVSYQYAGSATVTNTFGTGGPLIPISLLPVGVVIGLIFVSKVFGALLVRLYIAYYRRKHPVEGGVV